MDKLKTFWVTLKRSITDAGYYKEILKAPLSFSIKYLFALFFAIGLIYALVFTAGMASLFPKLPGVMREAKSAAKEFYPGELVIKIKNGELETNVQEPYFLDWPEKYQKDIAKEGGSKHFITIDTKAQAEDYDSRNTLILLTKKSAVYPDQKETGGFRVQPLSEVKGPIFFDRNAYNHLINRIMPLIDFMIPIFILLLIILILFIPIALSIFGTLFQMVYIVFLALPVWFFSLILKRNLGFAKVYQLSIHGFTLPLILSTLQNILNVKIPFTYNTIFLIFMAIVLISFDKNKISFKLRIKGKR